VVIGAWLLVAAAAVDPAPRCDDPTTQLDMNLCAAEDYKRADAALNAQWSVTATVMKAQDEVAGASGDGRPGYFQALLGAQRAWLAFRDAQCRIEGYAMRGGSAEPMAVSACLADVTRARTAQLKAMTANYRQ